MAWRNEYDQIVRNLLYQMGAIDVGNIYWVIQSSKSFYNTFMGSHLFVYPDGSKSVYSDAGTGNGIAAAIAAAKGGRNDYIIVGTGNYNLTAALTLAGKSSLHLVGLNGGGYDIGTMGAAALTQTGAFENVIMSPYSELTGFQIINAAGYSAVTIANGIWRCNIHHNYFHMTQGAAASIIKTLGSGLSYGRLARNRFETWIGGILTAAINVVGATGCDVCNNIITMNSGAVDFGITMGNSAQSTLIDNIISDCNGGATIGIVLDLVATVGITVVGNRIACAAGEAIGGGTANRSFIDNRDSYAGGATPIET